MNPLLFPLRIIFDKIGFSYRKKLAVYLADLCEDNSKILDVGCDDGTTADLMKKINPTLSFKGIDIQTNRACKIPKKIYDGKKIPYKDKSFDIVMAVDVLHHTTDILSLLKEMKRVAKKYIIIKDHIVTGFVSNLGISAFDYFSNIPYGIKCSFNYLTEKEWMSYFKQLNLKLVAKPKNLNFSLTDEKYNPIFKLKV